MQAAGLSPLLLGPGFISATAAGSHHLRGTGKHPKTTLKQSKQTQCCTQVLGVLPLDGLPPDEVMEGRSGAGSDSSSSIGAEGAASTADAAASAAAAQSGGTSPRSGGQLAASPPQPQQQPQRRALELTLSDGFHRLLVHGIAQFHGLSRSVASADECTIRSFICVM